MNPLTRHAEPCELCGALVAKVMVIPEHARKGTKRRRIALDPTYDPATSPIRPSHALSAGYTTCRPITRDNPLAPGEHAGLTHHATCPLERSPGASMPRPRRLALVLLRAEREYRPATAASAFASAASLAHTNAAFWYRDDPALASDYERAAALLEDRYARVWKATPA
jgi:hypothetical protein